MGFSRPNTYTLHLGHAATTPLDSTTYYFGDVTGTGMSTTESAAKVVVPRAGRIRAAVFFMFAATASGTAEDWVFAIRKNATTDYTWATVSISNSRRNWEAYSLDIPVSAGDALEVKVTCPAWVTNPEGCRGSGHLLVECW